MTERMDALALLKQQVATANDLMTQVFAGVNQIQAGWRLEGSTANPIGATFLHAYFNEDRVVQEYAQGQRPLWDTAGWRERLHYDPSAPWSPATLAVTDPEACRAYAVDVHAATRRYLESLQPGALEREIEGPRGTRPLFIPLSWLLVTHKLGHMGEIAALLGCQGVKGFPF